MKDLRGKITLRTIVHNQKWHFVTELQIIKDLVVNMEDYFLERCIEFEKDAAKRVKKAPKYSREELEEILEDEFNVVSRGMPILIRQSLFISTYSLLETYLNELCSTLKEELKMSIDVSDLNGAGIFRAQNYLAKILNVDFPQSHRSWQKIGHYNRLRNCFAHANGQLSKETNKQLLKFIKDQEKIEANILLRVELQEGFVEEVCDTMTLFARELLPRVQKVVEA